MANYQKTRVKLINTHLNKLRSVAKNNAETKLGINRKNFEDEVLPHELFLALGQRTKIRNAFASNMSTVIKLSRTEIYKVI